MDRDAILSSLPFRFYSADACARDALDGVARNRALIVVTAHARILWFFYRLVPRLVLRLSPAMAERTLLRRR